MPADWSYLDIEMHFFFNSEGGIDSDNVLYLCNLLRRCLEAGIDDELRAEIEAVLPPAPTPRAPAPETPPAGS